MNKFLLGVCLVVLSHLAYADQEETASPETIGKGAKLYEHHCSACHGPRMADPEGAFDLRKFPPEQHNRFVNSVTNGKNSMPPWGGLLKPDEIESLWAYVVAGEKRR
ncbi:MAG TPA: cytochrome c [Burkholderiales bacterium]|nr:cytochrome c [Burkholderiales bacterium]